MARGLDAAATMATLERSIDSTDAGDDRSAVGPRGRSELLRACRATLGERLDRAVAENERRIRDLTRQAEADAQAGNYKALADVLNAASKLQRHNARLFKLIDRTEARLMTAARQATRPSPG